MADKKKIALLGAGTMGIGIAQMFAQAGHEVKLIYVYDDKVRARPRETMEANLNILREEGVQDGGAIPASWTGSVGPSLLRRLRRLPMLSLSAL